MTPRGSARVHTPSGLAITPSGNILVADTGNGLVRVHRPSGVVTTAAWSLAEGLSHLPACRERDGDVYVTDERGLIVEASSAGRTRTLAGSTPGFRDDEGPGHDSGVPRPLWCRLSGVLSWPTPATHLSGSSPRRRDLVCTRPHHRASIPGSMPSASAGSRCSGGWRRSRVPDKSRERSAKSAAARVRTFHNASRPYR